MGLLGADERAEEGGYALLLDVQQYASPPSGGMRRNDSKSSMGSKKVSNGNLYGLARESITSQLTPNVHSPVGSSHSSNSASWDLLHHNTLLHNTETRWTRTTSTVNEMEMNDSNVQANSMLQAMLSPLRPGSERTAILTFVATALGSGVLALPSAFSRVGLGFGVVALTVAACLSSLTLAILMMASRYTEAKTFGELLTLATGSNRMGLLLDVLSVMYGFAVILALLIFEGDFVPAIVEALGAERPDRTYCIVAVAICAWPLVLPSEVSALRYVAAVAPLAILYVASNVVFYTPVYYAQRAAEGSTPVIWNPEPVSLLQASSIFVFSVMCHGNAVPVANMLERPSVQRIVKVTMYSNTCCWALYTLIGLGGYLSFQSLVQGDFLSNYPVDSIAFLFCRIMLTVVCYVGIPMNSAQATQAFRKICFCALQNTLEPEVDDKPILFASLASLVLAASTVGAIYLTDVAVFISIVGGSLTTLQMFWLPAIIYWKILYPTQPNTFRKLVMGSMIAAGICGFASVFSTLVF